MRLSEPEPARGVALEVAPGIRRVVAPNPGPMTYHGTNTWLIDSDEGVVVLDPGPAEQGHLRAVLREAGGTVSLVLLSHRHSDHYGNVQALCEASGAPLAAFGEAPAGGAVPGRVLRDGDLVAGMRVLHTPGHAADHLCFARPDGVVFTGDHVMGWSTSTISPPGGVMADYVSSLRRLAGRDGDRLFLSGHGPAIEAPQRQVEALLRHRLAREATILATLRERARDVPALTESVYSGLAEALRPAAARNVLAHLLKLQEDGRAAPDGTLWRALD